MSFFAYTCFYAEPFDKARKAAAGRLDGSYYLCYYQRLDYVVPFAFQGPIVLICDFEDKLVNDIYNMSPKYHTKEIHVAVFPLESTSVVMMIVDGGEKRYRHFYKQLNKLTLEEQLSAINYMVFIYSENVFVSKSISDDVFSNQKFLDVCQKSNMIESSQPIRDAISIAIKEFSFSKCNEIPNLLNEIYALPK